MTLITALKTAVFACAAVALVGCKDDTNRVLSQHTSPAGYDFTLLPILEQGVSDVTIAAAWPSDWMARSDTNEWVPGLGTELMLSGGTADLAPADVADLFDQKNSWGNIYPTADHIYAEVEFPNNFADDVLPVMAELFQTPRFDPAAFDRQHAQWLDRVAGTQKTAGDLMWEASRVALLGPVPQLAFQNGTDLQSLRRADLDAIQAWHAETFAHRPSVIVVTGATTPDIAGEAIDTLLGPLGSPPMDITGVLQPLAFDPQTIFLHDPQAQVSTIAFIGPLPAVTDSNGQIDLVAAHLLGAGTESPLFKAIREDLGATYGLGVELAAYSRSQRALAIHGQVETAQLPAVRAKVLEVYSTFLETPDMTALGDLTDRIAGSVEEDHVYVSSSAITLRELLLQGRVAQAYHSLPNDLRALTADQIQNRLDTAFPRAADMMIFASGPDATLLDDACIITVPEEVTRCLQSQ